uniref:DNA-directed primase/polymerase protein n=1 Tax=Rhabditophanes sp. KR3021 TaxID=114890 RepID=A0AC35U0R6_9BILA
MDVDALLAHKAQIDKIEALFETFPQLQPAIDQFERSVESHRIFSYEAYNSAHVVVHKYIATDYRKFRNLYLEVLNHAGVKCRPSFSELITEGAPCRLYFDLEYDKGINPHTDPSKLLDELKYALGFLLLKKFGINHFDPDVSLLILDGTTDTTFFQHVIVHLPKSNDFQRNNQGEDWVFASNVEMRKFMDELWHLLIAMDAAMIFSGRVNENNKLVKQPFIDSLLFTKNRSLRIFRSVEMGESVSLELSESCKFYQKRQILNPKADRIFRDSLCLVPPPDERQPAKEVSILPVLPVYNPPIISNPTPRKLPNDINSNPTNEVLNRNVSTTFNQSRREWTSRSNDDLTGLFPQTEQFIVNEIHRGGICSIGNVKWYKDKYISVTIIGSKYSEIKDRNHTSNGISFRVFPQQGYLYPYCSDAKCHEFYARKYTLPYLAALEMRDECIRKFLTFGKELKEIIESNEIQVQQQVLQQSVFQPIEVITIDDDLDDSFNESLIFYEDVPTMDETNLAIEVETPQETVETEWIKLESPGVQNGSGFLFSQTNGDFAEISKKNTGYI